MHIAQRRCSIVAVLFLLCFCTMALAQVGPDLLIKSWGEGAAVEGSGSGLLEAATHIKDDNASIRLSSYEAVGRWRINPDSDATPRIGFDLQYLDIETNDPALPRHLWNGQIGFAQPFLAYEKWFFALAGSAGYAGNSPFSDSNAVYGRATLIAGRKFTTDRALVFGLDYDGNRTYAPDIPIPGFAFTDRYNEFFNYVLGFPYSSITWEPIHGFQIEAGYEFTHTFDAKVAYQLSKNWAVFGAYTDQLTPYHIDNTNPDRRLFFQTHDVEAGVRWNLTQLIRISLSGGWAFGQEFSSGWDARGLNPLRHVADAPFGKLQAELAF
jgi:hypothetical protein